MEVIYFLPGRVQESTGRQGSPRRRETQQPRDPPSNRAVQAQRAGPSRPGPSTQDRQDTREERNSSGRKSCEYETFTSPKTFDEAWHNGFFPAVLLMFITSVGFIIKKIPILDKLPIGGRL